MAHLNIGQVAQQVGIQQSTIRYYESIGLVPPPPRLSGWRRYGPDVLDRLSVIRTASDLGFKLDEIRLLLDGFPLTTAPSERWRDMASQKLPEVRNLISRAMILQGLLEAGVGCDCSRIETCISSLGEACRKPVADENNDMCQESAECGSQCGNEINLGSVDEQDFQ